MQKIQQTQSEKSTYIYHSTEQQACAAFYQQRRHFIKTNQRKNARLLTTCYSHRKINGRHFVRTTITVSGLILTHQPPCKFLRLGSIKCWVGYQLSVLKLCPTSFRNLTNTYSPDTITLLILVCEHVNRTARAVQPETSPI